MKDDEKTPKGDQAMPPIEGSAPPVLEKFRAVLVKHNPEAEFAEGAEDDQLISDYDQKCERLSEMMADNKRVSEAIMAEPTLAAIITDIAAGVPFEVSLAKNVDLEAVKPLEGEPNYEEFQSAVTKRRKREAEIAKSKKELEQNLEKASALAEEFFTEEGVDDEDREKFVDFVDSVILEVLAGNFTKMSLKKLLQAYRYDGDVEAATRQGEIDGRNASIEASRQTSTASDGVPSAGSGGSAMAVPEPPKDMFDQIIERGQKRRV